MITAAAEQLHAAEKKWDALRAARQAAWKECNERVTVRNARLLELVVAQIATLPSPTPVPTLAIAAASVVQQVPATIVDAPPPTRFVDIARLGAHHRAVDVEPHMLPH